MTPVSSYRDRVRLLGVSFDTHTVSEVRSLLVSAAADNSPLMVTFRNPHYLIEAEQRPELTAVLAEFDLVLADGWGVVLGARLSKGRTLHQISAEDLLKTADEIASRKGQPIAFVGGRSSCHSRFVRELRGAGIESAVVMVDGFQDLFAPNVIDDLCQQKPAVVFASLGAPLQEEWCLHARTKLDPCILVTSGGMVEKLGTNGFDPLWLRRVHLGWAYLSIRDPRRFTSRYALGIPRYLARILRARFLDATPERSTDDE